jgi:hypothetical protein
MNAAQADVRRGCARLCQEAAACHEEAQGHVGGRAGRQHVPPVGRPPAAAATEEGAAVDDQRGVAEDKVHVTGDQAQLHVDPCRGTTLRAPGLQRVLVAQQAYVRQVHAVGLHRQRHPLRTAAFTGAGGIAHTQPHMFQRIVGNGQVQCLKVVGRHDHRGAAQRADDGQRLIGVAWVSDLHVGTLGLAAIGVADDDDRARVVRIADQCDRCFAGRNTDPFAVDARRN